VVRAKINLPETRGCKHGAAGRSRIPEAALLGRQVPLRHRLAAHPADLRTPARNPVEGSVKAAIKWSGMLCAKNTVAVLVGLVLVGGPGTARADDEVRSGFWRSTGIGFGGSGLASADPAVANQVGPAIVLDSKLNYALLDYLSIGLWSHLTLRDFDTIGDAYSWLERNSDRHQPLYWLPLGMGYATAWLLGTNLLAAGPMLTVHQRSFPGLFFDFGFGLSIFFDGRTEDVILGSALAFGVGVDFTPRIGLGTRLIWSPADLHSRLTPSDYDVVEAAVMLIVH
jgi:hypothetical protein